MPIKNNSIHCGIDFGTTNSSLSTSLNNQSKIIPIDPENSSPHILKSLIYLNPQQQFSVGTQAIKSYLHDLDTFPSKPPRLEYTGHFIKTFGPSTGDGAGPPIFVPEIVEIDDSGRGRLLQSLKSVLTSSSFTGTNIFGKFYTLEDLLTILLSQIKTQAEKHLNKTIDSVVLGRPVRYVGSGQESTALDRMYKIAQNSGFKNIEFELEPIGAALNYGLNISNDQKILVFDFGGGTLDICIMKLPEKKVISVSGRPIGGDLLSSRLVESKLNPHFGSQSIINNKIEFPKHFLYSLSSWYQTTMLKNVKDIGTLQDLVVHSNQPDKVQNFLNLIVNDYGFEFFRTIDQSKINLSTVNDTVFDFNRPNLSITQKISRSNFEAAISMEIQESKECINQALRLANLKPVDIDKVILTGGSSQIPVFIKLITDIFNPQKVIGADHFTSVALGLGLRAEQIFH